MAPTAWRVAFSYRGDTIRMEAAIEVAVLVPPSHEVAEELPRTPFFFDLQDEHGRVLYRRRRTSPVSSTFEVPTGNPSNPFRHESTDQVIEGAFSILVPALAGGVYVELFGTSDGLIEEPPGSLGRFDLRTASDTFGPPLPPRP